MKNSILFAAFILTLAFAPAGHARSPKLHVIDMTGSKFQSDSFNLMDDGLSGDFDGFGLRLSGEWEKDFVVTGKTTDSTQRCEVKVVKADSKQTLLQIIEELDVDSGDTCELHISYRSGASAVLSLYSQGT
jgi:hypothetical protein